MINERTIPTIPDQMYRDNFSGITKRRLAELYVDAMRRLASEEAVSRLQAASLEMQQEVIRELRQEEL